MKIFIIPKIGCFLDELHDVLLRFKSAEIILRRMCDAYKLLTKCQMHNRDAKSYDPMHLIELRKILSIMCDAIKFV